MSVTLDRVMNHSIDPADLCRAIVRNFAAVAPNLGLDCSWMSNGERDLPSLGDRLSRHLDDFCLSGSLLTRTSALFASPAALRKALNRERVYRRGSAPERLAYYVASFLANQTSYLRRAERSLSQGAARVIPAPETAADGIAGFSAAPPTPRAFPEFIHRLDRLMPGRLGKAAVDPDFIRAGEARLDPDDARIEPDRGLLAIRPDWPVLKDALAEAAESFARPVPAAKNPGKVSMRGMPFARDVLDSAIMKLALDPLIVEKVSAYLGMLPILYRINILLSLNDALQSRSSQLFHLDPEDFRQVKVFILVSDVDQDSGPLHVLRADASDVVRSVLNYRRDRLADRDVFRIVGRDPLCACSGPSGTIVFADTSRCFHFGSRPGSRIRQVIMFQYLTPFAASFPITGATVTSKYGPAVQQRAEASGTPIGARQRLLFGLDR